MDLLLDPLMFWASVLFAAWLAIDELYRRLTGRD